jgi:hypothetical protein
MHGDGSENDYIDDVRVKNENNVEAVVSNVSIEGIEGHAGVDPESDGVRH